MSYNDEISKTIYLPEIPVSYSTGYHHVLARCDEFRYPNKTNYVNPPHIFDPSGVDEFNEGES